MKRLFLLYALLIFGHGDRHLYSVPPQFHLKVISFNLLFQGGDHQVTLKTLQANKADVLMVQEVSPQWELQLRKSLHKFPHQYYYSDHGTHGFAVLSRYPLANIDYIYNNARRPIAQCFVIRAEQELFACNVHLASPAYLLRQESLNIGEYMKTHQKRTLQWGRLSHYIGEHAAQRPVILAGDFNTLPIELLYHTITRKFTDAWDRNISYGATFPNRPDIVPQPILRIDYVFMRHAQPLNAEILSQSGSDHLGLKVELGYWYRHTTGELSRK